MTYLMPFTPRIDATATDSASLRPESDLAQRAARDTASRSPRADAACNDPLREALDRIDAIVAMRPRVVLLGEENAGKTALANALLGVAVLPESAIANTRTLTVLRHAARTEINAVRDGERHPLAPGAIEHVTSTMQRLEIGLPLQRLAGFDIVDTPGLGGCGECPDIALTQLDLPIWCTRAGQAWKESERRLWSALPRRFRSRAILAVTNADTLRDRASLARVQARLAGETEHLFSAMVFTGKVPAASQQTGTRGADDPRFGADMLLATVESVLAARARRTLHVGERLRARILGHAPREARTWIATANINEPASAPVAAHGHSIH